MLPFGSSLLGLPRYEIRGLRHRKKGIELQARYRGPLLRNGRSERACGWRPRRLQPVISL